LGGQAGYNYMYGGVILFGVEGDIGQLNASTQQFDPNFPGGTFTTLHSGAYGDITGRFGVGISNVLIYVKGGWAQFDGHGSINNSRGGFGGGEAFTSNFSGSVFGAGIEYMFWPSWSAKIEYRHFDFGTQNATLMTPAHGNFRYSHGLGVDAVTAGINFHFNPFPF
jgi:outer membrane immunogenic protein